MKSPIVCLCLLVMAAPASGLIYECRDRGGNLFLTDDPDNLPPDCPPEKVVVREEKEIAADPSQDSAPGREREIGGKAPIARTRPVDEPTGLR